MKFYCIIFYVALLIVSTVSSTSELSNMKESSFNKITSMKPEEIVEISKNTRPFNKKINISYKETDPIKLMKLQQELIDLYLPKPKKLSKKLVKPAVDLTDPANDEIYLNSRFAQVADSTDPSKFGEIGNPANKEYRSDEAILNMKCGSDNNYILNKVGSQMTFSADNVNQDGKFWCSEGNHYLKQEVVFRVELEKSARINAFWIQWAFAPGEFLIRLKNDEDEWQYPLGKPGDFILSKKGGNADWWNSVLRNPKLRWAFKTFDQRYNFEETLWGKYIEIIMRVPVNIYFGIYKLELYTKTKTTLMFQSRMQGGEYCLSTANGMRSNFTPVFALPCLQGISYGDNRDVFLLHSNGYITTESNNFCVQSPSSDVVNVVECGVASNYKDDREKWILDYDGKIRSMKEQFSCLSLADNSAGDLIPLDDMKSSSSSVQDDGIHSSDKALDISSDTYWASNPTTKEVVYEVLFHKYQYTVKTIEILWKFPATNFEVWGLMPDAYWKMFYNRQDNRDTLSIVNIMNFDIVGIKIKMIESSTKIEDKSVYGIKSMMFHTGAKFLVREACKDMQNESNLWKLIEVNHIDDTTAPEYNQAWAKLRTTRTQFSILKSFYNEVPKNIMQMKERSISLKAKLMDLLKKFQDTQLKIIRIQKHLDNEKLNIFFLGTNEAFPATDCAHIIRAFPSKRSGMYWIRNECTPTSMRVFCDFDSYEKKAGLDYIILNNNQPINTPIPDIKTFKDVRLECAKYGLEPIEIKNSNHLKNIYNLLITQYYDLNRQAIIPIAYDYSCDYAKCSKAFRPLNSEKSNEINDILNDFNARSSGQIEILSDNGLFDDSANKVNNVSGLGINDKIMFLKLDSIDVIGIPCSTNDDGTGKVNTNITIECNTNMRASEFSGLDIFTNLRMVCPRNCSQDKSPIYGSGIFTDNSSICRAAIHSGTIKDAVGGIVEVIIEPGQNAYKGSPRHGIDSLDWSEKWVKSFRINQYKPYCPIDKLKDYEEAKLNSARSFLEIGVEEKLKTSSLNKSLPKKDDVLTLIEKNGGNIKVGEDEMMKKLKEFNNDKNLAQVFKDFIRFEQKSVLNNKLSNKFKLKNKLKDTPEAAIRKMGESDNHDKTDKHDEDELTKKKNVLDQKLNDLKLRDMVNLLKSYAKKEESHTPHRYNVDTGDSQQPAATAATSATSGTTSQAATYIPDHSIPSPADHIEHVKIPEFKTIPSKKTTEEALLSIKMSKKSQYHLIGALSKLGTTFKALIGKTSFELENLRNDKELGLISHKNALSEVTKKVEEVKKYVSLFGKKTTQKLKRTEHRLLSYQKEIMRLMIKDEFKEDYRNNDIYKNYEVFSSELGVGKKPEWKYSLYNLDGHLKTIVQTGRFMDNKTGSHLVIRNRDFYDFELKFTVNIKDKDTFGVAFRYKNPYTYYIFEMSNRGKGFKQVRKFLKGVPTVLDRKEDGGYNPNTWYNVKIRARQAEFYIYLTTLNTPDDLDKKYEQIFYINDNELVHGTIAFASFNLSMLLIDNIDVIHVPCFNFDKRDENSQSVFLTPTCPRFYETLTNAFIDRWKEINPLSSRDGPAIWKVYRDIDDRELVLGQMSRIYGISENEEGTIYLLKDETKTCSKGKWSVKFKALDDGIFSLIFRYNARGDYYIFEISGQNEKFVRIRKKLDGVFSLLVNKPLIGYKKNNWHKVVLMMDSDKINAYLTPVSLDDTYVKLFDEDIVDTDLKSGLLGVGTYKTRAYFDEVTLSPLENNEEFENNLYIDEEELPLPVNRFKNASILDRINKNIKNFTWKRCLQYPTKEDRNKYCEISLNTSVELDHCKTNFCESCCYKNVDKSNKIYNQLCNKQCNRIETGGDKNKGWNSCITPRQASTSIYPHCDEIFTNDFYSRSRCKVDMCNLCCTSYDFTGKTILKFDITPDNRKGTLY